MLVLTSNPRAKSLLSLLLREIGQPPSYVADLDSLDAELNSLGDNGQGGVTLVHHSEIEDAEQLARIQEAHSGYRLVGFELFETASEADLTNSPLGAIVVLPKNAERAKARLKSVIKTKALGAGAARSKSVGSHVATKVPFPLPAQRTFEPKRKERATLEGIKTRYLVTESPAFKAFVQSLSDFRSGGKCALLLGGEDGCEFELAARALNFIDNADSISLRLISPREISAQVFEDIEAHALLHNCSLNCWITDEDAIDEAGLACLQHIAEQQERLPRRMFRIIMRYEGDGRARFPGQTQLRVPSLSERPEDIAAICQSTLANLRLVHPFLQTRAISEEVVRHFIENRKRFTYEKLVRSIRNTVALAGKSDVSVDDFLNYGESDMTTQHLMESMADEVYFPSSDAATA